MSESDHQARLRMALQRETAGERVVWQAQRLARTDRKALGIYLFAVPWTAFSVMWTTFASVASLKSLDTLGPMSLAFPLFGVPFIAIGVFMLASPFTGLFMGSRTLYAATDRRLIKLSIGRSLKTESVPMARLGAVERNERPDGSGSLVYGVRIGTDSDGDSTVERFAIADVADVFEASRRIDGALAATRRTMALSS